MIHIGTCARYTALALGVFAFGPASADDGFKILLQQGSWTVFKFEATKPGDPASYCSARSGEASAFFELLGTKEVSCLSAEARQWRFGDAKGEVGFGIGGSAIFVDSGQYFSNGLQICGGNGEVDGLISAFWSAQGSTIDVYRSLNRKLGSFPAAGREKALRAWKACRASL